MNSTYYFAERAYLEDGWAENVRIEVSQGKIVRLEANAQPADDIRLSGPVLPTMANLHSHAFQRLMAGLAEVCLNPDDSFWSWRDRMYQIVRELTPEDAEIIATRLYIEMLKAGYTQVGEFHYLHHGQQGTPYANKAEMSERMIQAANTSGIGLTLLPVLYSHSGFGGQPATAGQARFIHSTDSYLNLQAHLKNQLDGHNKHQLGLCFHSLRAVTPEQIHEVLASSNEQQPIHIHIAEQQKEVNDCLTWSGQRPVEWLHEQVGLDRRWCLVHATHLNQAEVNAIASSGAVAGLCPTTEANLGDGIFRGTDFVQQNGVWGIGSDSHVSLSIVDELRTLEYSQRLRDQQRNRLYSEQQKNVGEFLFDQARIGGNQACGIQIGLQVGARADFMTLDAEHPFIGASPAKDLINRWLFACNDNLVCDVYVAGEKVVDNGHHAQEEANKTPFMQLMRRILSDY